MYNETESALYREMTERINLSSTIMNTSGAERPQIDTDHASATERMMVKLQHILDLAGPAREEIAELANKRQQENMVKQESNSSNETLELQSKLGLANEQNSRLRQQLGEMNKTKLAELEDASAKIKKLEMSVQVEKDRENQLEIAHKEEVNAYKDVNFDLEKRLASKAEELKTLQISKDDLKKNAIALIKEKEQRLEMLRNNVQQIKTEKENLAKELSETKSRLSKVMGDKLSDNNPNIADLSDENRPTKLAEKYQELYDNQWTDAYETVLKTYPDKTEQDTLHLLLTILMQTYKFCKEEAESQKQELIRAVYRTQSTEKTNICKPVNIKEFLKEIRRASATDTIRNLTETFLQTKTTDSSHALYRSVKEYVHECITICWMMERHDPPLVILQNIQSGDTFDGSKYKPYTKTGTVVEYVVWPALLLHHEGPLLCKGVAQCTRPFKGSKSFTSGLHLNEPIEANVHSGSLHVRDNGTSLSTTVWIPCSSGQDPEKMRLTPSSEHKLANNEASEQLQPIGTSHSSNTISQGNTFTTDQSPKVFHSEIKTKLQVNTPMHQQTSSNPEVISQQAAQPDVGNCQNYHGNKSIHYQAFAGNNKQQAQAYTAQNEYKETLKEHKQSQHLKNPYSEKDPGYQSGSCSNLGQPSTNYEGVRKQESVSPYSQNSYSLSPLIPSQDELNTFHALNQVYPFSEARLRMGWNIYDKCFYYLQWLYHNGQQ